MSSDLLCCLLYGFTIVSTLECVPNEVFIRNWCSPGRGEHLYAPLILNLRDCIIIKVSTFVKFHKVLTLSLSLSPIPPSSPPSVCEYVSVSAALTPELKNTLDKVVTSHKVVLFMKGTRDFPQCGFSNTVVQILKSLNVPFETINILENELLRQGLKEYSSWPTFPQLYVEGEFFGGCDITVGKLILVLVLYSLFHIISFP